VSWDNLSEDVAELFSDLSQQEKWRTPFAISPHRRYYYRWRVLPTVRAYENAQTRRRRRQRRTERMLVRPPCPTCGGPVKRDSKRGTAKIPIYCQPRCARLHVQRAFRARIKAAYGVTRRPRPEVSHEEA
jgi:endogenous inhibitor of DNA gyrase (YacG/DUF329 family)